MACDLLFLTATVAATASRLLAGIACAFLLAGRAARAEPAGAITEARASRPADVGWHAPIRFDRADVRDERRSRERATSHTLRQHRDDPASAELHAGLTSAQVTLSRPSYVTAAEVDASALASTLRRDAHAAAKREAAALDRRLDGVPAGEAARVIEFFKHDYIQAYYGEQHKQAVALVATATATLARLPATADPADRAKVELILASATTLERETRVLPIGGRMPRNAQFAGAVYPVDLLPRGVRKEYPASVRFTADGFPDFAPYAIARARLPRFKGDATDFTEANRQARLDATPAGYTWHHVQDGSTLLLIPSDLHSAVQHTGGAAIAAYATAPDGYWHIMWHKADGGRAAVHR